MKDITVRVKGGVDKDNYFTIYVPEGCKSISFLVTPAGSGGPGTDVGPGERGTPGEVEYVMRFEEDSP